MQFARADRNHAGNLDAEELAAFVQQQAKPEMDQRYFAGALRQSEAGGAYYLAQKLFNWAFSNIRFLQKPVGTDMRCPARGRGAVALPNCVPRSSHS
jgi:hypothetical protein